MFTGVSDVLAASTIRVMEAARNSKTSVNFHQTTRLNIPENSHLQTRPTQNLKCHDTGPWSSMKGKVFPEQTYQGRRTGMF
jgi:hypothetical protein